jgi:hypothetical protein
LASPRSENSGRPGDSPIGTAGRCSIRGDPEAHRQATPKVKIRGNPENYRRFRRRMRESRKLDHPSPAQPEGAEFGATRRLTVRRYQRIEAPGQPEASSQVPPKGCEIRGNSMIHRRLGLNMQEPGQLGASSEGLKGRCMDRATCEVNIIEAPGTQVPGAFDF